MPDPASPRPPDVTRFGAYGFRIEGLEGDPEALGLNPLPEGDSTTTRALHVSWAPAVPAQRPTAAHLDDDGACLLLLDGGYVAVQRATGTAVVHTRQPVPPEDVVHPYLAGPAGIFAHWEGWMAFHAGAVVHGGGAWALLGDKGAGKTTTLAHLDDRGVPVLTDDLLVTDGVVAHPGPRALDLRPDAATRRGQGGQVVREGERVRVALGPVGGPVPFLGWVVLAAGPTTSLRPVPVGERLSHLRRALAAAPSEPERLLDLLTRPMVRFERPLRWEELDTSVDVLLERLSHPGG
jgi:hypothetical protein